MKQFSYALAVLLLTILAPALATAGAWSTTSSLITARSSHTATLLPNGTVLVAGGTNSYSAFRSAELYDPATGTWSATGNLTTPRNAHTATVLPNGTVLVAGGNTISGGGSGATTPLRSADLYDPATGTW